MRFHFCSCWKLMSRSIRSNSTKSKNTFFFKFLPFHRYRRPSTLLLRSNYFCVCLSIGTIFTSFHFGDSISARLIDCAVASAFTRCFLQFGPWHFSCFCFRFLCNRLMLRKFTPNYLFIVWKKWKFRREKQRRKINTKRSVTEYVANRIFFKLSMRVSMCWYCVKLVACWETRATTP